MNRLVLATLLIRCILTASLAVGVLRNSKAVSFKAPLVIPTTDQPSRIAIADMDGDGKSDIVALNYGTQAAAKVEVYRNTTLATVLAFDGPKLLDSEPHPIAVAVSDLDKDGKPDIVVGHFSFYQDGVNSGRISIYRNTARPARLHSIRLWSSHATTVSKAYALRTSITMDDPRSSLLPPMA